MGFNMSGVAQGMLASQADQQNQAQQQQDMAAKKQLMQLQALQLESARSSQAMQQRNATMQGWDQPINQPPPQTPPPGQSSVPMMQSGSAPPQSPPPQGGMPPPGFQQGMGMPSQQPMSGGMSAQMQPGGMPPPQQQPPRQIPPYQTVQGMQQRQQPPSGAPMAQQAVPMAPPQIKTPDTPEQARDNATAQVMKLASGPDAYNQLIQNVMAHGAAQGQQITREQAAQFIATDPGAQYHLKILDAQRKEAMEITEKAQQAGSKAYVDAISQLTQQETVARDKQNAKNEDRTRSQEDRRIGLESQRVGIERQKQESSSASPTSGYDSLSPARKKEVDYYAMKALDSGSDAWKSGLSRDKDGRDLIKQVNARVPELAEERGQSPEDSVVRGATVKADSQALTQNTKDLAAIRPFKKMLDTNADVAIDLGKNVLKTNSAWANKSLNWLKENAGDNPDAKEYMAQMVFVQTEAARVLNTPRLVGQLSDSARHEMQEVVDGNTPIKATERVLNRMKKDGDNRLNALMDESKALKDDIRGGNSGAPSGNAGGAPMSLDSYLKSKGY